MSKLSINDAAQILGIGVDATREQLRKAYKRLILMYHPDKNQNNPQAEEMTKKINEANAVFENYLDGERVENTVNSSYGQNKEQNRQNNPVVDVLKQEYEKAVKKHRDLLDNDMKAIRQKVAAAEAELQDLLSNPVIKNVLDKKIECIDKLKSLLLQQKLLVGQAMLLADVVQQCKKRYEDALGRCYSGNAQDGR